MQLADWAWIKDAACRDMDPNLFFKPNPIPAEVMQACAVCSMAEQCLASALAEEADTELELRFGVRAGTTGLERRDMAEGRRPVEPVRNLPKQQLSDAQREAKREAQRRWLAKQKAFDKVESNA